MRNLFFYGTKISPEPPAALTEFRKCFTEFPPDGAPGGPAAKAVPGTGSDSRGCGGGGSAVRKSGALRGIARKGRAHEAAFVCGREPPEAAGAAHAGGRGAASAARPDRAARAAGKTRKAGKCEFPAAYGCRADGCKRGRTHETAACERGGKGPGRLPRRGAAPQPDPPEAEGPGRLRRAGRASVSAGPRGRIAGRGFAARSPPRTGMLPVAERMMLRFVTSNCNFQTKHRIFIKFFIPLLINRHEFAPISIKTLRYYVR